MRAAAQILARCCSAHTGRCCNHILLLGSHLLLPLAKNLSVEDGAEEEDELLLDFFVRRWLDGVKASDLLRLILASAPNDADQTVLVTSTQEVKRRLKCHSS
ncbi:hypothetical protein SUGI_0091060 [Cryptomeria japonica]|nr:hypothetical protein SUGI_0091060 [Cryptomeria japonica]